MSQDFIAAIKMLASEKNISEEQIFDAISSALITAYRKDYGNKDQDIEVDFLGHSIESATIYVIKEVVDDIEDEDIEVSLAEAKKIQKDVEIGDEIRIDVTPVGYGRIATQSAKQVILQRLQEAEKDSLYRLFKDKEDSVLFAVVNRVEGTHIDLSLDKHTVSLRPRHQIPGENYYSGKRISIYLDKVKQTPKGPQLSISRTHKNLIRGLLEREIPEIASEDVVIDNIARDPGVRSKVAVSSETEGIDAVGACVGQKGMRINTITDELAGERIDLVEYHENPEIFIKRSLQPADIAHVVIINDKEGLDGNGRRIKKRAAVFVEESERAMAVGKRGQNIRLATDLTGFELDMYNIEELELFMEKLMNLKGGK
ncbi:transcription termination/antitermination protein NusA [Candidatus Peregrinibacteria bacterium]|nr:MAG: transcription termination/antitermination protein NusA [Candidatus Peregrinibacteria bacterium]